MGSALENLRSGLWCRADSYAWSLYQHSWIILFCTTLPLSLVYIFAMPILKLLGQDDDVADLAGKFAISILPELFSFPFIFPMQKFLQSQRKVMAMAWIAFLDY